MEAPCRIWGDLQSRSRVKEGRGKSGVKTRRKKESKLTIFEGMNLTTLGGLKFNV